LAVKYGNVDVVKFLIANMTIKMPQTAKGWSPLHYSAFYGQLEATKALLDAIGNNSSYITQHAFKEANYYTPLHEAVGQGQIPIVELFLDRIVGNKNPKAAFTNYVSKFLSFFAKFSLFKLFLCHCRSDKSTFS
jgi:ankyrin repeat protein